MDAIRGAGAGSCTVRGVNPRSRETGDATRPTFFRAGIAGSWRTVLTPVQVRAVVDAHGEVMERFGYLKEARAFLRGSREPEPR